MRRLLLILIVTSGLLLCLQPAARSQPFTTIWHLDAPGDIKIQLDPNISFNYDFSYTWKKDGITEVESDTHTKSDGDFVTSFTEAGDYQLEISGTFDRFSDYPTEKLTDVTQWGDIKWKTMNSAFHKWGGTGFSATDIPDLSEVISMHHMFREAPNFNGDLSKWDVGNIESMYEMFYGATAFNSDISDWDVSKVTSMHRMFRGDTAFNQDIGRWNVSQVTKMGDMFRNATSFNVDLSAWDVSSVNDMSYMFYNCASYNKDITDWDIGSISGEGARNMLDFTDYDPEEYDKILIAWAEKKDLPLNVKFGADNVYYCKAQAARDTLTMKRGWVITDEGKACSDSTDILSFVLAEQTSPAIIDTATHTVFIEVNGTANLASLSPGITVSTGATISPGSGVARDFTLPVSYEVTAEDGTTQNWTVTVAYYVNDAPFFIPGSDQFVDEDAGPQAGNWATDITAGLGLPGEDWQTLTFIVTNDNPGLFAVSPAIDTLGVLTYTPAADANGEAKVNVVLKDDGGTEGGGIDSFGPVTFTITIAPVNDAPSFVPGPDQAVTENAGAQLVNWATDISAGPSDESVRQVLTFTVTTDNNSLFSVQPAIDTSGVLTYTPAADTNGEAEVDVVLKDDGGIENGGIDSTDHVSFTITVMPENNDTSLIIPSAFTPNDDGVNDVFEIRNREFSEELHVRIMDRAGNLIFQSEGYADPWDGSYQGKKLPKGTYFYSIRESRNGQRDTHEGFVVIL